MGSEPPFAACCMNGSFGQAPPIRWALHECRFWAKHIPSHILGTSAFAKRPGGWPVWRLKAVLKVLAEP